MSVGDEVLAEGDNELIPVQVISISSYTMQGNIFTLFYPSYFKIKKTFNLYHYCLVSHEYMQMSQGLLGLCCLIETRDRIERITLTAVLFN